MLEAGGVIVYPTEAVMGLGCSPWNEAAVARVLRLKRRPASKGLIVVAAAVEQLDGVVDFSRAAHRRREILASWPGPVTWLLPATPAVPEQLTGRGAVLAVRVSAHPVVRELCTAAGLLVSTSANPSGCMPARTAHRARAYFGTAVDYYVPGAVGGAAGPSSIKDALSGRLVRPACCFAR